MGIQVGTIIRYHATGELAPIEHDTCKDGTCWGVVRHIHLNQGNPEHPYLLVQWAEECDLHASELNGTKGYQLGQSPWIGMDATDLTNLEGRADHNEGCQWLELREAWEIGQLPQKPETT